MEQKIIMCNNCGGEEITHIEGKNLGICKHCGATIIMPRPNEEIIGLLNTAYLQRATYDFDAAIKTYEYVLDKDSQEKSAYEGLLLAKYGIEYIKDPRSSKLIPTCHRTHFNSIYEDDAYLSLVALCDEEEKEILKDKFAKIDKLQKAIAKQLEKEEDFDVFISYKATDENGEKTEDSVIARNIYDKLTEKNYKVFLAEKTLEDRLGSDYEPIIFKAIQTSKIFVLVGTKKEYVNSVWVKNEWTRFVDRIKNENNGEISSQSFIPVFKDMSPYDMPKVNNKFVQGVDASKIGYAITVTDGITKLLKPKDTKDVIKTFNDFENIVEFKRVQKQAKKEHHKKQISKLKENKLKYALFLTMEILCFVLPLVMIGISFTQKFPFLQYCNFWIFLTLGLLWIVCFVFVLVYKGKTKICQSVIRIVLSSICMSMALLFMILTSVTYTIYVEMWGGINPGNVCGVYSGGYYNIENNKITRLYNVKPNSGNDFIVPEYINGIKVELQSINGNTKYESIYIDTKNINKTENFYFNVNVEKLEISGEKINNFYFDNYGSIDELEISFPADSFELHSTKVINNVSIKNKIQQLIIIEGIESIDNLISHLSIDSSMDSFSITDWEGGTSIEKVSINALVNNLRLDLRIDKFEVNTTINDLKIEKLGGWYWEEVNTNNNVERLTIEGASGIKKIKIGENIDYIKITAYNVSGTGIVVCFEGDETEWNAVEKDIPDYVLPEITVLFNQSI